MKKASRCTITTRNFFFCLVLLPGVISGSHTIAAAQGKGTCLINNKVTYDCDLGKFKDTCSYNGQILPCNKTPEGSCGNSGLLVIKLNEATKYFQRSIAYDAMGLNLFCRGISVGFLGAASDVTAAFSGDFIGIGEEAEAFLNSVSPKLAQMNGRFFKELADTGKLRTTDGRGYLTDAAEIDAELIKREQELAQEEYDKLSAANKALVTQQINSKIHNWIRWPSPVASAMKKVRDSKRRTNPNAEFDYSDIKDRIAVGNILATEHRKTPIRVPL
jgi:hypothetical protein